MSKQVRVRPWHRSDLDTDSSWPVFCDYYMTPPEKRYGCMRQLADKHRTTYAQVREWSSAALWRMRAADYDRVQGIEQTRIHLADKRSADKRHRNISQGIIELVAVELKKKLKHARRLATLGQLTDRDMARLADVGVKLERLIDGKPTERTEDAKRIDLAKLSIDEIKTLHELQKKAGAKE